MDSLKHKASSFGEKLAISSWCLSCVPFRLTWLPMVLIIYLYVALCPYPTKRVKCVSADELWVCWLNPLNIHLHLSLSSHFTALIYYRHITDAFSTHIFPPAHWFLLDLIIAAALIHWSALWAGYAKVRVETVWTGPSLTCVLNLQLFSLSENC